MGEGCVKGEIQALRNLLNPEVIRVTVRRKNLWQDYIRARKSSYTPMHTIKITFCGEPGIDDGGLKREFFSEMLEYFHLRLFSDGCPKNSVLALANEDFRMAGELMAMSIVQGGPGPNLFSPVVYNIISRDMNISDCKSISVKETCQKVLNFIFI